jgi:hypothetical protein
MTFNDAIAMPRSDVRISPLGFEHAENMLRWMTDPDVSDNVGLRTQPSLEGTDNWLRRALEDRQPERMPYFWKAATWATSFSTESMIIFPTPASKG